MCWWDLSVLSPLGLASLPRLVLNRLAMRLALRAGRPCAHAVWVEQNPDRAMRVGLGESHPFVDEPLPGRAVREHPRRDLGGARWLGTDMRRHPLHEVDEVRGAAHRRRRRVEMRMA